MIEIIQTHNHPLIKHVISLHSAKNRTAQKQFIAEGLRTINTLYQAGHKLVTIFISDTIIAEQSERYTQATDPIKQLLKLIQQKNKSRMHQVKESVMEKMSTVTTPSGILAVFSITPEPSLDKLTAGIVLASLQDPGNVGTLIRTAAAMNKKTVVFIESVDPWSPKVVQASMGAVGLVDVFVMNFETLLKHKKNIPLCALVAHNGKAPQQKDLKDALIMVGSEAHGIPEAWVQQADCAITLPMPGHCESLNAAVAGSIALYLGAN